VTSDEIFLFIHKLETIHKYTYHYDHAKLGASMKVTSNCLKLGLLFVVMLAAPKVRAQGPPYQTDDPTPVDYKHYEAYIFGGVSGTPVAYGTLGPAFEFNWGAIPRVQIHVILPLGGSFPSNNPVYAPSGVGPRAFGLTDMEFGVKLAIIKQTKYCPQIGTFTMLEIPTGSYSKGLGEGKAWYKLPAWVEKEIGPWTLDGGVGYALVRQVDFRDFLYGGFLVKREINKKLELGAEVFSHAREGLAAPQTQSSTLIDAGGYYHFKNPDFQFLFAYGHSVAGQTENYAYLGLYYTWGKDEKKPGAGEALMSRQVAQRGYR
jgi:hypothetical protein